MTDRILVVDDDPDFIDLVRALLHNHYVVEGCTESTRVLERIRQVRPGLVFLDLHMPPPTGWDLLRMLREDAALAEIPVLVVSAAGTDVEPVDDALRRQAVGPVGILPKPFEIDELFGQVSTLITRRCREKAEAPVTV